VNTPSHYVLNVVALGYAFAPDAVTAITLGAIAPDIPIFLFYAVAKLIYRLPEAQIWSEAYYESAGWQTAITIGHSFPLAILGLALCLWGQWRMGFFFFASMIGHSLLDIPVHHDDAHRHFFPLSHYRFISPLSYWDPRHHGRLVAAVELLLVLGVSPLAWTVLKTAWSRGILVAINGLYLIGYSRFYLASLLTSLFHSNTS
jgi:hypothetical protein